MLFLLALIRYYVVADTVEPNSVHSVTQQEQLANDINSNSLSSALFYASIACLAFFIFLIIVLRAIHWYLPSADELPEQPGPMPTSSAIDSVMSPISDARTSSEVQSSMYLQQPHSRNISFSVSQQPERSQQIDEVSTTTADAGTVELMPTNQHHSGNELSLPAAPQISQRADQPTRPPRPPLHLLSPTPATAARYI